MNDFVVITGLSGAGRSQAGDILEDLGWFVIDNLPPSLIPKVSELARAPGSDIARVALVVGTGPYHDEVLPALNSLRAQGARLRIVFLEASTDVLVRRYESTRRRHPLDAEGHSLADAIEAERGLLDPVKVEADLVVDTSDLNVHQLRARMLDLFGPDAPESGMQITVQSFGYRYGIPLDTDLVIDCRFLPNPYWEESLRDETGRDEAVRHYVLDRQITEDFLERVDGLLEMLVPAYVAEGKSYLTIAFGCTGGRHRSVAIAERIVAMLDDHGFDARINHRDMDR